MKNHLQTSARMAIFIGIFLPLAETLRRFRQLSDPATFLSWFDDYILGGVLLAAAWAALKNKPRANAWLIAAWGIGVGALFLSFLGQFQYFRTPGGDPGGMFSVWFVLIAKGLILAYLLAGLWLAVRGQEQ